MRDKKLLGDLGEEMAAGILYAEGYDILERNFRCHMGELDLILRKEGVIYFAEVKTRLSQQDGTPEEAVDARKRKRMRMAGGYYLKTRHLEHVPTAFLVIGIQARITVDPFLD